MKTIKIAQRINKLVRRIKMKMRIIAKMKIAAVNKAAVRKRVRDKRVVRKISKHRNNKVRMRVPTHHHRILIALINQIIKIKSRSNLIKSR